MGSSRGWLKAIAVSSALLFILLAGWSVKFTAKADFCAQCHEMKAGVSSWQNSTHDRYSCVSCHELSLISKSAMLFSHVTKLPVSIGSQRVVCLKCHRGQRVISPAADLIVPHQFHICQNIDCTRCHPAAGHSTVNGQATIKTAPPAAGMAYCLTCHYRQGGTLNCRGCHRNPPITPEHLQPNWLQSHGNYAFKDVKACNNCHSYTLFLSPNSSGSVAEILASVGSYAKNNVFCADCHRQRPPSHNSYFLHDHATVAVDREAQCLVCHSWNYPFPTQQLPSLFCQKCHVYPGWVTVPWSQYQYQIK